MVRLSVKAEYACLALAYLSKNYDKDWVRIEEIADSQDIPQKFLEQILLLLKQAGYLKSRRGSNGGYALAKPPDCIRIADIVRLISGPLAPVNSVSKYFYEKTPTEKNSKLTALFKDIRDYTAWKLENTYFSDMT
ncbi:MAG: Rrf2 family transcriptional regulator [Candidatus Melainabacteria bacterium GWF2_37_15]|nr:MAG: Rrf2 family transcriptional regulator [Candidatus Melainabacteria bacterium GWF2_37_15]